MPQTADEPSISQGTCKLWAYGNNTCSWASRCAKPASADINCEGSADSCCISSPAATFTPALASACSTRTGGLAACSWRMLLACVLGA